MACIVFSDNTGRQIVYSIDQDRVTMGRNNENDIVSLDLRVSRHHASILKAPDGTCAIRDEGSSLGLVFSREIVELHGGRIGVVSEPGRGASFQVILPVGGP